MKLNFIVASLCVLGWISHPIAASAHVKNAAKHENYKGEADMPSVGYKGDALPAQLTACPSPSIYAPILDAMSQNVGRAKPTVDCNKPIQFAGGVQFDTQFGNLDQGFMGENNNRFSVNDAYINATGTVNEWVNAFIELNYNTVRNTALNSASVDHFASAEGSLPGIYSDAYSLDDLTAEQAYVMLGNPEKFPLFLKVGKQYQDFGRYTLHPLTRSMTQVMTETLQTSAELSFISTYNSMDLHGSGFVFQNPIPEGNGGIDLDSNDAGNNGKTNYGVQLGLGRVNHQLGWDIGVGYIYNLFGVNDIAYAAAFLKNDSSPVDVSDSFYVKRVSGLTAYGMVNSGPFSLSAHYVTALQHFDTDDFGFVSDDSDDDDNDGIKPWAADIQAAYGFNYWERNQAVYVGYQRSHDASQLFLPEQRWLAGYGIDVLKNTNVGVEYSYDMAYGKDNFQDDKNSNRVALRIATVFG